MDPDRNELNPDGQNSFWLALSKLLFVVFLAVMLFLLTRSMLRHHFFSGGQMNQHDFTGR